MKTRLESDLERVEKLIEEKEQLLEKKPTNLVLQFELKHLNQVRTTLNKLWWLNHMSGC